MQRVTLQFFSLIECHLRFEIAIIIISSHARQINTENFYCRPFSSELRFITWIVSQHIYITYTYNNWASEIYAIVMQHTAEKPLIFLSPFFWFCCVYFHRDDRKQNCCPIDCTIINRIAQMTKTGKLMRKSPFLVISFVMVTK